MTISITTALALVFSLAAIAFNLPMFIDGVMWDIEHHKAKKEKEALEKKLEKQFTPEKLSNEYFNGKLSYDEYIEQLKEHGYTIMEVD